MGVPTINTAPMTIDEFYAFTDKRPDVEKWELIEGEPVLQASTTRYHNYIVANLIAWLNGLQRPRAAAWKAIPGIGARVS